MAAQVSPGGCAPRNMRSTLYCVEVIPHLRILQWNTRCSVSEVRIRFSNASSSRLEKGRSCTISSFSPDILEFRRSQLTVGSAFSGNCPRSDQVYCFATSRSMLSLISSPTIAGGILAPITKAARLRVVVAEKPACCFPPIPGTGPFGPSTSNVTG